MICLPALSHMLPLEMHFRTCSGSELTALNFTTETVTIIILPKSFECAFLCVTLFTYFTKVKKGLFYVHNLVCCSSLFFLPTFGDFLINGFEAYKV